MLALEEERSLQSTNVAVLFRSGPLPTYLKTTCKKRKSPAISWIFGSADQIIRGLEERVVYLHAFTNWLGVRRHGYAANFVAMTMLQIVLICNSLQNKNRSIDSDQGKRPVYGLIAFNHTSIWQFLRMFRENVLEISLKHLIEHLVSIIKPH